MTNERWMDGEKKDEGRRKEEEGKEKKKKRRRKREEEESHGIPRALMQPLLDRHQVFSIVLFSIPRIQISIQSWCYLVYFTHGSHILNHGSSPPPLTSVEAKYIITTPHRVRQINIQKRRRSETSPGSRTQSSHSYQISIMAAATGGMLTNGHRSAVRSVIILSLSFFFPGNQQLANVDISQVSQCRPFQHLRRHLWWLVAFPFAGSKAE